MLDDNAADLLFSLSASLSWLAESRAAGTGRDDAMRAMRGARIVVLTAAQRAEVRELVGLGLTRAEAVEAVRGDAVYPRTEQT